MEPALKVFEEEITQLKKQVEGVRKKMKSVIPSPSSADLLNRLVGKKATFWVRNGQQFTGTLVEHDRYNALIQTEEGQVILLKHALDVIKPLE